MASRSAALLLMLLTISLLPVAAVQGQASGPAVTIECSPDVLKIDIGPGDSRTGTAFCTLENPSAFSEEIEIEVEVEGVGFAAPDSVLLGAGDEETIAISFVASPGADVANIDANVSATVSSFNSIPCLWCDPETDSIVVAVGQYAEWSMTVQTQFVILAAEATTAILIEVENRGNDADDYSITILNESGLQKAGLSFEVTGDTGTRLAPDGKETLTVTVSASDAVATKDWEIRFRLQSGFDSTYDIEEVFNLATEQKPQTAVALASLPPWALPVAGAGAGVIIFVAVALVVWRIFRRQDGLSAEQLTSFDIGVRDDDDDLLAAL